MCVGADSHGETCGKAPAEAPIEESHTPSRRTLTLFMSSHAPSQPALCMRVGAACSMAACALGGRGPRAAAVKLAVGSGLALFRTPALWVFDSV